MLRMVVAVMQCLRDERIGFSGHFFIIVDEFKAHWHCLKIGLCAVF